jgi:hypothetical protein
MQIYHSCFLVFSIALISATTAQSARIYFTDQPNGGAGSVVSVAPDGTDQRTVITLTSSANLRGIAWHRGSGRIYYLDNGTAKKIFSILPNGSNVQDAVSISATLLNSDVEIDEAAAKIYWSESTTATTGNGFIRRSNLDGSESEAAVTTAPGAATAPYFIFLDPEGGYIYWGVQSESSTPSSFRRATFAGVIDPDFSINSPTRTRDIAIDRNTLIAYWCDRQTGSIYRRELNGTINQLVIGGMNAPHGIALDVEAQKVYWADTAGRGSGPFNTSARRVARCNFDGTEYENVSTPNISSEAWDLALDTASPTYAEWRTRFFSINTPAAGMNDDADADGASNLLEYALGTHPRRAVSVPAISSVGTSFSYVRRIGSNLSYRVEFSTDLATWNYNGDASGLIWTTETSVTPLRDELETVVVSGGPALEGAAKAFFRVRVAAP